MSESTYEIERSFFSGRELCKHINSSLPNDIDGKVLNVSIEKSQYLLRYRVIVTIGKYDGSNFIVKSVDLQTSLMNEHIDLIGDIDFGLTEHLPLLPGQSFLSFGHNFS